MPKGIWSTYRYVANPSGGFDCLVFGTGDDRITVKGVPCELYMHLEYHSNEASQKSRLAITLKLGVKQSKEELKAQGLWVFAADMDGQPWCSVDYAGAVGLVVGSEGAGVSRLVKEKCDFVVSLPMNGKINSLNASVAAGIVLYEVARQRLGLRAK